MDKEDFQELAKRFKDETAENTLEHFFSLFKARNESGVSGKGKDRIALASSLGAEDQVLTHMVLKVHPDARIFILDTGRFYGETYELIDRTMRHYNMHYEFYFPESSDVEDMEGLYGPNLFYESIELRKKCCFVRKVKPLMRVLSSLDVWITGLRREQAVTREGTEKVVWDEANGLIKINPLAEWSEAQVWEYIKHHRVPYSRLHDQGYPSIGCAPCTRAVRPGEDIRGGRWWWETPEQKECGLHLVNGKLVGGNP